MGKYVKFSSKMDADVLDELREHSKSSSIDISQLITEAVKSYLQRKHVRPVFNDLADEVMEEYDELLKDLAK